MDNNLVRPPVRTRATPNITPFTYYDGATYLEILEALRKWLRNVLVPEFDGLAEYVDEKIADMLAVVDQAIDSNQEWTEQQIADLTAYVDDAVQQIINDSIEAQDPVVSGIIQDEMSDTNASLVSAITNGAHPVHEAIRNMHTTTRMFIPAHAFGPIDGSRSPAGLLNGTLGVGLNLAGGVNVWRMPPDVNSAVGSVVEIPPGWHTFDIRFYWAHTIDTPSGQINILAAVGRMEEGQDITTNGGANAIASVLMPPRRTIGLVDIPANTTLDGQGNIERIIIARQGGSGADTFAYDAGFIGVELVKTT